VRGATILLVLLVRGGDAPAEERIPLTENYSPAEMVGIFAVATADLATLVFERQLLDARGEPVLGQPWGWDREVSESLYRGPSASAFLARIPDRTGQVVAPALTLGLYAVDGLAAGLGRRLWGHHADHELLALVEAYGVTVGLTQAAKLGLGRLRPEYELGRRADDPDDDAESTLAFFSLHASSSFCLAAFVSRDLGDWLGARGHGWIASRLLPSFALYGAAGLIGASRIVDQKHYLTDVATGALVGAAAGNLFYWLHFDEDGRPRHRRSGRVTVMAFPSGLALGATF
jgi:membrane-associated phospholipid phosphatase